MCSACGLTLLSVAPWPGAQSGKVSSHLRQQKLRGGPAPGARTAAHPAANPAPKRGRSGAAAAPAPDAKRIKVLQNPAFPPPPPSPPAPAPATRRKRVSQKPAASTKANGRHGDAHIGGSQPSKAGPRGGEGLRAAEDGSGIGGRECFMAGARLVSALLARLSAPPESLLACVLQFSADGK